METTNSMGLRGKSLESGAGKEQQPDKKGPALAR